MKQEHSIHTGKWALAALFLVDGSGFGVWAAHVPVYKQNLGIDNAALTLVLLSVIVGALITMPITGQVVARFGSRSTVRVIAPIYVVTVALLAQASTLWVLIALAGVFGAAKGAFDVVVNAQAIAVERHYRHTSMSFLQGCWSLGGLLGAAYSSEALRLGGTVRLDLSLAAAVLLLGALCALPFLIEEDVAPPGKHSFRWPSSTILRIAILAFFGLLTEGAIADWAAVYLHSNLGASLSMAAKGFAAYAIAMAAARFLGDWLAARVSGAAILVGSGALISVGLTCTLTASIWWIALAGLMLVGVGVANIVPVLWGMAGRDVQMGAGPAISAVTTIGYFGFLSGPPLIGFLSVFVGLRIALAAVVLAGVVVASGPLFLSFKELGE